jgi:hypothetical protein
LWTDANIERIRTHFIAVAVPTEICRAEGPEGEFLRAAGIDEHWVTSAGYMDCVSASGKSLGRGMASEAALQAFRNLPDEERKPGAVQVPKLSEKERLIPSPPENGLVLRVHGRFLNRAADGELRHTTGDDFEQLRGKPELLRAFRMLFEPNVECMWLTEAEWKSLLRDDPVVGQRIAVDPAIAERMARFHLSPRRALTSEDGIVDKREIKIARLSLVVDGVSAERLRLRLTGFVHTGSDYDAEKATSPNGPLEFGFATPIHGVLDYDRANQRFVRFDVVAPGEVWGRWGDANNNSQLIERSGREPIGFAFELATGDSPSNRIPPGGHGARALRSGYFAASGK